MVIAEYRKSQPPAPPMIMKRSEKSSKTISRTSQRQTEQVSKSSIKACGTANDDDEVLAVQAVEGECSLMMAEEGASRRESGCSSFTEGYT